MNVASLILDAVMELLRLARAVMMLTEEMAMDVETHARLNAAGLAQLQESLALKQREES